MQYHVCSAFVQESQPKQPGRVIQPRSCCRCHPCTPGPGPPQNPAPQSQNPTPPQPRVASPAGSWAPAARDCCPQRVICRQRGLRVLCASDHVPRSGVHRPTRWDPVSSRLASGSHTISAHCYNDTNLPSMEWGVFLFLHDEQWCAYQKGMKSRL